MEIIEQHSTILYVLAFSPSAFTCAGGIGANDVANAMGTSVGSGAISVRAGADPGGDHGTGGRLPRRGRRSTATVSKGIIDGKSVRTPVPHLLVFGMMGALLAAGLWLMVATMRGWPVSTTHAIIGAVCGVGVAALGFEAVKWDKMGEIVASWFISPVLGGSRRAGA
jgi:PiT family inorganic phosphate transporter